ncbi:hypothetical protein J437_LFUL008260 [Ladona fulva]|uniref:Peptide deformylase n=1 Tax=Ladona fulva TaxID=123851 RepID=A0A8K0K7M3_LADFU|nr:hypothetical protein J437_LFUL008260 [Ladona fulva]
MIRNVKTACLLLTKENMSLHKHASKRSFTLKKIAHMYRTFWLPKNPKPPYDHICQIGDPVLRNKAELVKPDDIKSEKIQLVIKKLRKALKGYDAAGVAAPQIGVPLRIFAVEFPEFKKKEINKETYELWEMSTFPFKVFINPEIKVVDYKKIVFPESCESVKGLNENGEKVEWSCRGWAARICQHEMDHLDGKIYVDSMVKGTLEFPLWQKINYHSGRLYLLYSPHK